MSDLFPDDPVAVQSRREAVARNLPGEPHIAGLFDDPLGFTLNTGGHLVNEARLGLYSAWEGTARVGARLANIPNTALETPSYFRQTPEAHRITDPHASESTPLATWLTEEADIHRREIRRLTPDPRTLTQSQQILGGLAHVLSQGIGGSLFGPAGSAAALGAGFGADAYWEQIDAGVDPETAQRVAIGTGGIGALMGVLPASIPIRGARFALWPALGRAASGAAINVGVGSWMRQSTHDTLMASAYGDYSENAERYQALDGQAMMVDAVLGSVFGTIFAHVDSGGTAPRAGEDGGPIPDGGEPIAPILSGGGHLDAAIEAYNDGDLILARAHALMADRLGEQEGAFLADQWAREGGEEASVEGDALGFMMAVERGLIKPTPEQVQAAMVMGDDLHARVTTAPGIPLNVHADVVHAENLRAYDEAASNGEEFPQARWSEEDAGNFAPRPDDVEAMARDIEFAVSSIEDAPTSLVDWVRRQGEIRDDRGRIVQRGGIRDDRGDIGGSASDGKRGFASLLSPTGRTIDDLIVNAWEDGFFPDHADPSTITAREFIDAVNEEGSNPGSRTNDSNAAFSARSARDVIRHYEKNGIDVSLRGNELRRALSAITREADAETAISHVLEQEGFGDLAREVESRRERIRQMGGEIPPDDAYFSRVRQGERGRSGERRSDPFHDERLTPQQNKAVEMARNNHSNAEIADEMDISLEQAGVLLSQARGRIPELEIEPGRGGTPGRSRGEQTATIEDIVSLYNRLSRQGYRNWKGRPPLGAQSLNQIIATRLRLTPASVKVRLSRYNADVREGRRSPINERDAKFSQSRPIFESAVERTIAESKTARASGAQWWSTISRASGVKREELQWIGLEDYLKAQEGSITREEVLAFVRENGVRVEETVLGTPTNVDGSRLDALQREILPLIEERDRITQEMRDSAMDSQALFSREQNGEQRPASPADLIAAAEREFGADWQSLTRAGNVEVVQSSAEVPTGLLGLPRGVQAVHLRDSRTTYFIANNVRPEDMKGLILHEIGVHHGMEAMVGKRGFREIMRQIDRMVDADHPALVEARALAERYSARDEHIPEETLAYLIETHADLPLVTSVMSQLRQWMVKTFGTTFGMQLTVDDLRALAITSLRRVAEQARREAGSVTEVLPIQEAVLASHGPDAGPVQGGRLEGRTVQGYHGTAGPLHEGTPTWWSETPEVAESFSAVTGKGQVVQADLNLGRNLRIRATDPRQISYHGVPVTEWRLREALRKAFGEEGASADDVLDFLQGRGGETFPYDTLTLDGVTEAGRRQTSHAVINERAAQNIRPRAAPDGGPVQAGRAPLEFNGLKSEWTQNADGYVDLYHSGPEEVAGEFRPNTFFSSYADYNAEQFGRSEWPVMRARSRIQRPYDITEAEEAAFMRADPALIERARSQGYDALRMEDASGGFEVIPLGRVERVNPSRTAPNAGDARDFPKFSIGQNGDNLVGRRNARRDPIEAPEFQERVGRLQEALSRDDASGESGASRGQRSDAPVKDGDAPDKGLARQARDVLALSGVHIARIPNPLLGSLRATIDSPVDLPARLRDALQEHPDARDYNAGIDFDVVEGGKSAADPSAPEGRRDGLYIRWTSVPDALQGAGIGSWLYRQVIDWAHRRGLNVYSDTSLTEKSWPMYDRLKEYGYEVEQISATTRDPLTKTRESINDEPIFEIRRSYEEKPYDAAEHPVEDYQIDGPTLRERQQRIDDQRAREDAYQKKSPIEQALADEPEMKLSMGRGRSVKASEAIEMSVEAQREAVAKKKAFEAAVRCAARHGGSMAARSFVTLAGRGATQAASASQLLGQGLGLTLSGPAAYAASHLARQNADPRGYAADRARMQAINVQDTERKFERGAHNAALASGMEAPSSYEEPMGGQSVSDLANAPGEDSGDVSQPLATHPSIDPETPAEQRRLQTDPLQTYPTPSVGETPGAIMRDGRQVARNDAGVAPVGPEASPETPSTEELLRVMGPIIRNGPRDEGKGTQPKSSSVSKDLPRGMVEEGNIDLTTRPVVRNDDGSISTVRSMSFEDEDGREVLIPTVSDDGQILSDDDAIQQYYDTGKHLGIFSNARAANDYAHQLHRDQERMYRDRQ